MKNQMVSTNKIGSKGLSAFWIVGIVTVVLIVAVLAVVFVVEWFNQSDFGTGVPQDSLEAALKLQNAGYSVQIEQEQMLPSLTEAASQEYGIVFSNSIIAYLKALDPESEKEMAEIFYFASEADAELLYNKMKENWKFTEEQGQLRHKGVVVYMGYGDVLDDFEK
jgi:competence protein ComGC